MRCRKRLPLITTAANPRRSDEGGYWEVNLGFLKLYGLPNCSLRSLLCKMKIIDKRFSLMGMVFVYE